jgi:rhodanese-related sulfurtransferase
MLDMASAIDELLERARAGLERIAPDRAADALRSGDAILIDIRSETQRSEDGIVPGAQVVPRNVLEWRCDPSSEWRDPALAQPETLLIVMCNEGYQSSLAAATLKELGLQRATDLVGGFQAWRAAGLPVSRA